jgi:hypothetical protein
MRRTTLALVVVLLLACTVAAEAHGPGVRSGVVVGGPRLGARVVPGHPQFHGHFHGHGFVRAFPRPFVFVNPYPYFVAPSTAYVSPPSVYVVQSQSQTYSAPQTMIGGSTYIDMSSGGSGAAGTATMPNVVFFPHGRYELRGDGITMPYVWVWIPNPPSAPPSSGESG